MNAFCIRLIISSWMKSFFFKIHKGSDQPKIAETNSHNKGRPRPFSRINNGNQHEKLRSSIPPEIFDDQEEVPDEIDMVLSDGNRKNSYSEENDDSQINKGKFVHIEIPIGDPEDSQDVTDYEHIIYRTMRERELRFPNCLVKSELTPKQRGILIDWIDRIHYKAQLNTRTLYRAIGLFDRALNLTDINSENMQVFGCAALLIASKMEDIIPIQVEIAVNCAKNAFTKDELRKKEMQLANIVDFDFAFPTPYFFLGILLRISGQTQESMLFARYVMEVCMTCSNFIDVRPSAVASTSIVITRVYYGEVPWNEKLEGYTGYSLENLSEHIKDAYEILTMPDREESKFIRLKYSTPPFLGVSKFEIPDSITELFV
ncbi:Cyclin, N-terminal domain containing protein [Trichomonas vaginalis G3]|uniref:Cyclin, N-terminal domain containing protein n=1 Tax=Trichomonas vaginalis (strain ATCC PRA-98 / G3) TaxID=412133 RepID=A2DQ77_TRIV3|nr:cell division [Trichomonas vaginalis G3]EAY17504.1 Cyclin, N-terminal domain containing protein [Trichomonas vaginalis G3]KAI5533609.1 cell division [Trichomonas vaginalis G3]|eukprot:XP_001329639.1 Cyclin, N-terminal domain containing protein [Trichomonas vaginalis G3]